MTIDLAPLTEALQSIKNSVSDKNSAPDRAARSGRCVEITTDEYGSILIAFVAVGPQTAFTTTLTQPEKGKLP